MPQVAGARPRPGSSPGSRRLRWSLLATTAVVVSVIALARPPSRPSTAQGEAREIDVSARRYSFTPARVEVQQNDLVTIHFTAQDIAHSFTVDQYRIAKRAGAGQTVTFEFRADRAGTFPYYCNLAIDEGCRQMHGELIVRPK